ncbi:metallophosphoesterase [Candidatus Saccharibacteria bacterium]|nr:metallophosphoesterase [Candidatus Saccharibacteria bacterium]
MKCFYYSRYRFYNQSIKHALKFFLISDIHFSDKVKSATLRAITKQASQKQPDYIIIAGDVVDSLDCIQNPSNLKRLTSWLEQLGKVAPVLIGLGNHDFYRKNPEHKSIFSNKRHWFSEINAEYINAINAIDSVQLLNNEAYEDDKVYIFGFTQAPEYFQFNRDEKHSSSIIRPGDEDLDVMLSDLDSLNQKLISNLPKHKAKIAIIHSPVFLIDSQVAAKLYEFDYFISGHMHNGVVPPVINDFWRSDRGLVAPGKKLFPRNARTKITSPYDKIITLGAVSTIQDSARPITFLNSLYPINIATLELTKNESLARKPDIKHQYISL